MLRQAQHERKLLNDFNTRSVRSERVEGRTASFSTVCPKTHHFVAGTKGETIVQIHGVGPWGITYVNPADDPRKK